MDVMPAEIELSVDELVLSGLAVPDERALSAALRTELERLIAEQGLAPDWAAVTGHGDVGMVTLPADAGPQTIGTHLGRSFHARLKP